MKPFFVKIVDDPAQFIRLCQAESANGYKGPVFRVIDIYNYYFLATPIYRAQLLLKESYPTEGLDRKIEKESQLFVVHCSIEGWESVSRKFEYRGDMPPF